MSQFSSHFKRAFLSFSFIACTLLSVYQAQSQQRRTRTPEGGRLAVIVDERLAALRDEPELTASLLQRISRGRVVAVRGARRSPDGVTFYRVVVTRRTGGWLQAEAVVSPTRAGDDARLLRLIQSSEDFDRIVRARIFLDFFPKSTLRAAVLMLYGEEAEKAAARLSRDATRRLDEREMTANGAPVFSYFLNYSGLDRYRRQGIAFLFDREAKRFHYNGESWREIIRRYPRSAEAAEARKRLEALASVTASKAH